MASPCEVHVSGAERAVAERVLREVADEARRIEAKYSRYRRDNVVHAINSAEGRPVHVDDETARLLRYAGELHALSGGRFDVTSGALRRAWRFDGSDRVPTRRAVRALMSRVGWQRVRLEPPLFRMPPGMEIDFGGIGKEYAVDRAGAVARAAHPHCLINFGGDLLAVGPRASGAAWRVGIERPDSTSLAERQIDLAIGALATSGDARRFLLKDGRRYGHVLDARTGWPVSGAPRSVTVAAPSCTQAGMLATFALLHGRDAESFLAAQRVRYWCSR
ncbi:MAG: FAD:protein FMN transferase [Gammaproteobacteria bacterium]|nr:FAD:protein FMN transferase [Gammaproteobacteria bacterium]